MTEENNMVMTDEKIAAKMPRGHYRVDEGEYKRGDLLISRDSFYDEFEPVDGEWPFGFGLKIHKSVVVARPMHGYHDKEEPSKAHTDDSGKPPLAKVPLALAEAVANVMEYGHKKYGDYNNYKKGMEISRNLSCALRHIMAFQNGEDNDPESEQNHLGHAAARLGFVLDNIKRGTVIDDR
jgi:hypothetical protein